MRFLGKESEINLNTKKPEFYEWKWIDLEEITNVVVEFKLEVYNKIKKQVKIIIKTINLHQL